MKEEILFDWHKKYFLTALFMQKMLEERNSTGKALNFTVFSTKSGEFVVFLSSINCDLYHYAGNNPLKYTDPDGRKPDPYMKVFQQYCEYTISGCPPTQSEVFNNIIDVANTQFNTIAPRMGKVLAQATGKAFISGMQFVSDYGSVMAVAAYASGQVEAGLIIDGVTFACDITLSYKEYKETGDYAKFISDVTVSFTASAIGNGTGKAAKSIMELGKKEFAEKIEPVITDAVSAGITTFIKLTEEPNDE